MIEDTEKPLVPKNPAGAMVAGGTLTALLGALGWVASEMIQLEKSVTQVGDRIQSTQQEHGERLRDIDEDVDKLEDRMTILEREVLDIEK